MFKSYIIIFYLIVSQSIALRPSGEICSFSSEAVAASINGKREQLAKPLRGVSVSELLEKSTERILLERTKVASMDLEKLKSSLEVKIEEEENDDEDFSLIDAIASLRIKRAYTKFLIQSNACLLEKKSSIEESLNFHFESDDVSEEQFVDFILSKSSSASPLSQKKTTAALAALSPSTLRIGCSKLCCATGVTVLCEIDPPLTVAAPSSNLLLASEPLADEMMFLFEDKRF